mmetsp:Transcript_15389/g.23057  ORF Transcript_15389/g.23057 Transcript_15389/m.23057 type:complete len:352 (+) Transcript_15389:75-1130(+)
MKQGDYLELSSDDDLEFQTDSQPTRGLQYEAYPPATPPTQRRDIQPAKTTTTPAQQPSQPQQQYGIMNDLDSDEDVNLSDDMDLMGGDDKFAFAASDEQQSTPYKQTYGGDTSSSGADEFDIDPVNAKDEERLPGGQEKDDSNETLRPWHIGYYGYLFDVTTLDVLQRIFKSVVFFLGEDFFDMIEKNPDLWGTFWIPTTLIFMMGATGNFATYLDYALSDDDDAEWQMSFWKVVAGGATVYGFVVVLSVVIWAVLKWRKHEIGFLNNMCIIGYSLFLYIPFSVICVIPSSILRWILLPIGAVWIALFLAKSYWFKLNHTKPDALTIIGIQAVCNIALMLGFRLYFFEYQD